MLFKQKYQQKKIKGILFMFKCKTKFTIEMQKQLNGTKQKIATIMTVIGGVGIFVYLITAFFPNITDAMVDWMLVFAVPLTLGIIMLITIVKTNNAIKNVDVTNEYEFNEDHMTVSTIRSNENIGKVKFYYKDFVKVKETKDYIYLYQNKASAFPVDKKELLDTDLIILRGILKTYNLVKTK